MPPDFLTGSLESFAGSKTKLETDAINNVRYHKRYFRKAPLYGRGDDLICFVGYVMHTLDYPGIQVNLEARPGAVGKETSLAAMKKIALREDWNGYKLDDPANWSGVWRGKSLASLLLEEDHVAAVKSFFVESLRQLREELTAFKKEHPDLPWNGES